MLKFPVMGLHFASKKAVILRLVRVFGKNFKLLVELISSREWQLAFLLCFLLRQSTLLAFFFLLSPLLHPVKNLGLEFIVYRQEVAILIPCDDQLFFKLRLLLNLPFILCKVVFQALLYKFKRNPLYSWGSYRSAMIFEFELKFKSRNILTPQF